VRELLDIVGLVGHHDVLADAHREPDQPDNREHVFVVVEETGLRREPHQAVAVLPHCRSRLEKFSLFYVGTVHLVKLPPVAVRVQEPYIFNSWIHITHML
jgi:hypothetical protein